MKNKFKFYALKLSLVMIAVFLFQTFVKGFTELFVLDSSHFMEVWRFVTAVFLHASLAHIVLNLFALLLFGSILESLIGGRKFLIVFFATGIFANLIAINFYSSSLGASGAIFGIIGTLIIVRPLLVVWAFGLPMPIFVAGILWIGADILGTIGFLSGNPIDNTGNIAHLSGMLLGFIFGILWRDWRARRVRRVGGIELNERAMRKWEDNYLR